MEKNDKNFLLVSLYTIIILLLIHSDKCRAYIFYKSLTRNSTNAQTHTCTFPLLDTFDALLNIYALI